MATQQREKIVYDFMDLRRETDPVDEAVLNQLGLDDDDLDETERHDDKKAKDDSEELDDKDGDLDDDGEYVPAKMTGAMRKRIVNVKRDAGRQIAAAKAEAGETISKLEKRVEELERSGKTDEVEEEFAGKITDLEGQIEAAMEAGDHKLVASLTRQMGEVTADKRDATRKLETKGDDLEDLDAEEAPKIIPRATEWIQEQVWWDDEDLGHVRAYVRKADLALQKKGYKPTDDDFYEQLESLVEDKYPGIVEHTMAEGFEEDEDELELDPDEDEDEFGDIPSKTGRKAKSKKKRRRRGPVSEGDRGGVARSKKKRRASKGRTLTRARIANMRTFGMDPENPQDVEAYFENNPDIG